MLSRSLWEVCQKNTKICKMWKQHFSELLNPIQHIIIIDFYSYTCQAATHKGKYQHNRTETINI